MTQRERRIAAYMNLHGLSRAAAVKKVDAKPAPKTAKKNPARRSTAISGRKGLSKTGYINRPSQASEHKAPSKRLKTRRKKALEAPQGYFPNPAKARKTYNDRFFVNEAFEKGYASPFVYAEEFLLRNEMLRESGVDPYKYMESAAEIKKLKRYNDAKLRWARSVLGVEEATKPSRKKNPLIPGLVARARKAGSPKTKVFTVQYAVKEAGPWKTQGIFPSVGAARDYARALAGKNPDVWFRVTV